MKADGQRVFECRVLIFLCEAVFEGWLLTSELGETSKNKWFASVLGLNSFQHLWDEFEHWLWAKHQCWTSAKLCWLSGNKSLQHFNSLPRKRNTVTLCDFRTNNHTDVMKRRLRGNAGFGTASNIYYLRHCCTPVPYYYIQTLHHVWRRAYLSRSTLRPVERRALLRLAEVRVVWVAAPQLFTRVERTELEHRSKDSQVHGKQLRCSDCEV